MKKTAKHCIDKLNEGFKIYPSVSKKQESKLLTDILNNIYTLFDLINTENYKKTKDIEKVNEIFYKDQLVSLMIKSMPICNQMILNSISSLFQITTLKFPDNSLPTHFIKEKADLDFFLSLFENDAVCGTAQIIFRACIIRNRNFTDFFLKERYLYSFFPFLVIDNFNKIVPAFATFDVILNSYIDLSIDHILSNWTLYILQFKILLNSDNYIILSYFMNILYKFLNCRECKNLMLKFVDDPENLVIIMEHLKSPKRRIAVGAYNLFKLFVFNSRRSRFILTVLSQNKGAILDLLLNFAIPDVPVNQEVFDDEHEQLLNEIRSIA